MVRTYANPPTTYTQGHTFLLGQGWEKTGVYVIIPPVTGSVYTRFLPAKKTWDYKPISSKVSYSAHHACLSPSRTQGKRSRVVCLSLY